MTYCETYAAQFVDCAIGEWSEVLRSYAYALTLGLLIGVVLGITRFIQR